MYTIDFCHILQLLPSALHPQCSENSLMKSWASITEANKPSRLLKKTLTDRRVILCHPDKPPLMIIRTMS